jgi:hypothetical protein
MTSVGCGMVTNANPIYDTVFKQLMENEVVARGLLSSLLDLEITDIQLRPQEVTDVHYATPLNEPTGPKPERLSRPHLPEPRKG